MILHGRKPPLYFPKKFFKKVDFQVGVKSALHQQLGTPLRHKLGDLFMDLVRGQDIGISSVFGPVKGAKGALRVTYIGIVHVAVNNKGNHAVGVELLPDFIGALTECQQITVDQKIQSRISLDSVRTARYHGHTRTAFMRRSPVRLQASRESPPVSAGL